MKIIHISPDIYPKTGGGPKHVHELATHQAKEGHEVEVIGVKTPNARIKEKVDGVKYKRGKIFFHSSLFDEDFYKGSTKPRKSDVVHIHSFTPLQNTLASIRNRSNKLIITYHGILDRRNKWYQKARIKTQGKIVNRFCDKAIALSEHNKTFLEKIFDNIVKIPNGVNFKELKELKDTELPTHLKRLLENNKVIVTIGRFHHQKGYDILLSSLEEVKKELTSSDFVHVFIGPTGGKEKEIERKINKIGLEDDIFVLTNLKYDNLISFVNKSAVFLLPSRFEGLPTTPLEALAVNTPVSLSKVPGNIDILKDVGREFKLTKESLSTELINLYKGNIPEFESIQKKYNWENISKKVLNTYREL